jgi:hypothetical protein
MAIRAELVSDLDPQLVQIAATSGSRLTMAWDIAAAGYRPALAQLNGSLPQPSI